VAQNIADSEFIQTQRTRSWKKNLPRLINLYDAPVARELLNCEFLETGEYQDMTESWN